MIGQIHSMLTRNGIDSFFSLSTFCLSYGKLTSENEPYRAISKSTYDLDRELDQDSIWRDAEKSARKV